MHAAGSGLCGVHAAQEAVCVQRWQQFVSSAGSGVHGVSAQAEPAVNEI